MHIPECTHTRHFTRHTPIHTYTRQTYTQMNAMLTCECIHSHHIHIHTHTHLSATHSHMNMHTHECIQPHIHARMYACTRITMCHSSLCYSWNQRPDRNSFILAQPVMARWGRQSRGAHAIASRKWRKPLHPLYPFPSLILPGSSACGTMAPKFPFLINLLWKHPHIHPHRRTSLIS